MSIWHTPPNIEVINQFSEGCMVAHLGIEITDIGDNYLCGKMPVDHRTKQPFGLLHGGASVTLAETLGSIASGLVVDVTQKKMRWLRNKRQSPALGYIGLGIWHRTPHTHRQNYTYLGHTNYQPPKQTSLH